MGYYKDQLIKQEENSRYQCDSCDRHIKECDCEFRCRECFGAMTPQGYEKGDPVMIWVCPDCGNSNLQV
jgi:Zn finger protein HypA/HybF involved in hydrogenase expression